MLRKLKGSTGHVGRYGKLNDKHLVRHFSAAVQKLASNKQCDDSVESTWAAFERQSSRSY